MIKLTNVQIDTLIERGYVNVFYSQTGKKNNGPWYKEYPIDGMSVFEIIVNPYAMESDIVVGCSGDTGGDDDGSFDCFVDAMDVIGELMWVKAFLIDFKLVIR